MNGVSTNTHVRVCSGAPQPRLYAAPEPSRAAARDPHSAVRRGLVAPVDELVGFTAVPNLGVVKVQASAAQLSSLRASATHAGLVDLSAWKSLIRASALDMSSASCSYLHSCSATVSALIYFIPRSTSLSNLHAVLESHQVSLLDALFDDAPKLSRFLPSTSTPPQPTP
jgi:hypothetical protein